MNKIFSIVPLFLLLLTGCTHYKAQSLRKLTTNSTKNTVSFTYQKFTHADCEIYLDRDLIEAGYQPIQLTLENNTNHYFDFSLEHFSFPCAPVEIIAPKLYTSTINRVLGYGIPGLIIFPLLIPAITEGMWSYEANNQLTTDYTRKALHNQVLRPNYTINGLIFVPIEYFDPYFSFDLIDLNAHKRVTLTNTNFSQEVAA